MIYNKSGSSLIPRVTPATGPPPCARLLTVEGECLLGCDNVTQIIYALSVVSVCSTDVVFSSSELHK